MINFSCPACGVKLIVKDDAAGKSARCSNCGETVAIPGGHAPAVGTPFPAALPPQQVPTGDQWFCMVDQKRYGPISSDDLQAWISQGRVTSDDLVWREGMDQWRAAGTVPKLQLGAEPAESPLDELTSALNEPSHRGNSALPKAFQRSLAPHRAGTVLTLGILGLVCCWICGIFAWTMGNEDLRHMAAGRMDPTGLGSTQAGRICGIISVIMALGGIVLYALILAGGLASR